MRKLPRRIPLHILSDFWTQLTLATRPAARRRRLRRAKMRASRRPPHIVAPPTPAIDPVALTVLALNRLGPATFRTVSLGTCVTVTVPDHATGAIFRAALGQTQKARATDRLIRIEVAGESARPCAEA